MFQRGSNIFQGGGGGPIAYFLLKVTFQGDPDPLSPPSGSALEATTQKGISQ